jgi:hypothetical protein
LKEVLIDMRVKRRNADHWAQEDHYTGDVDGAFRLLHDKYLLGGWVARFEGRLLEELREWDARLKK